MKDTSFRLRIDKVENGYTILQGGYDSYEFPVRERVAYTFKEAETQSKNFLTDWLKEQKELLDDR